MGSVYWLTYQVNQEKQNFMVKIRNAAGRCVYKIVFTRKKMWEVPMNLLFFLRVSAQRQSALQIRQKKLTNDQKNEIHEIFPYLPKFTNLKEFCFWYKRCNPLFSYEKYQFVEACRKNIAESEQFEADGKWKCMELPEENYLYCKWKDMQGNVQAVMLDDEIFASNLSFDDICAQESLFEIDSVKTVELFAKKHTKALLDVYIEHGGKKLFSFLTSPKMNHPMELLGKAGLAKLADQTERFEEINASGKNFKEIFGVPLPVLKSLENGEHEMLCVLEDREVLAKAYQENRSIFSEPMTEIGGMWLSYYYTNAQTMFSLKQEEKQKKNLAATIRYLNQLYEKDSNSYKIFGLYQNYVAYAQRMEKYIDGIYPKDLEKAVEQEIEILQERYEAEKNGRFQRVVESDEYKQIEENLENEKYQILAPKTVTELQEAGKKLCNCLAGYTKRIRDKETKVVLIHDKEEDKLIGAMEVYEDKIIQALGECNKRLSEEVWEYLERYQERKGLGKWLRYQGR